MWRKFTVYGLRFSKTSFWNRMNTGFLDPAVATVPTACGIETTSVASSVFPNRDAVATVPTACGIETTSHFIGSFYNFNTLQQCLPLAVLKLVYNQFKGYELVMLQQCLPLAVLKLNHQINKPTNIATAMLQQCLPLAVLKQ